MSDYNGNDIWNKYARMKHARHAFCHAITSVKGMNGYKE